MQLTELFQNVGFWDKIRNRKVKGFYNEVSDYINIRRSDLRKRSDEALWRSALKKRSEEVLRRSAPEKHISSRNE